MIIRECYCIEVTLEEGQRAGVCTKIEILIFRIADCREVSAATNVAGEVHVVPSRAEPNHRGADGASDQVVHIADHNMAFGGTRRIAGYEQVKRCIG